MICTKRHQSLFLFCLRLGSTEATCAHSASEKRARHVRFTGGFRAYVDAERASAHLSISRKTLLRLARRGAVPAHAIGQGRKKMWRFRLSELDHCLQTEVTSTSDEGRSQERKNFL
jgi:hypothetical protein